MAGSGVLSWTSSRGSWLGDHNESVNWPDFPATLVILWRPDNIRMLDVFCYICKISN